MNSYPYEVGFATMNHLVFLILVPNDSNSIMEYFGSTGFISYSFFSQ